MYLKVSSFCLRTDATPTLDQAVGVSTAADPPNAVTCQFRAAGNKPFTSGFGAGTNLPEREAVERILITGGAGFIGRHVARELLANGYEVRLLDSLVEQVHGDDALAVEAGASLIRADIRDPIAVSHALNDIDAVVHLAAEVGVGQSMYEIARYVGANELGTAVLLEAMIKRPIRRVVVASSMSVYGEGLYQTSDGTRLPTVRREPGRIKKGLWNPVAEDGSALSPVPTPEDKPVDLASVYALTKYTQERLVLIFGEAYGVDAVALRLFNVFGPGQALSNPYTGVLANFAARLANGQPPLIFEDGEQRRDFIHVRDVARGFRQALEQPQARGQVFNVGSGRSYAIKDVATALAEAMGVPEIRPEIMRKARAGDIRNCFADISKARELLGFAPRHMLEDSLAELVLWIRGTAAVDRGDAMKRELEALGLVS
jgi:dTDP-L-rhamnose 4-epimerase